MIQGFQDLEVNLVSGGALVREAAAMSLSASGPAATEILARVAGDAARPIEVRVTALRYLPYTDAAVFTLAKLLIDPDPMIRVVAIQRAGALGAVSLLPLIGTLVDDEASVWDLDLNVMVSEVASATVRSIEEASRHGIVDKAS